MQFCLQPEFEKNKAIWSIEEGEGEGEEKDKSNCVIHNQITN